MDLNTLGGGDLISLKESLQTQYCPTTQSPPEENDMEADEYARINGLTIESFFNPWPEILKTAGSIAASVTHVEPGSLIEDKRLQECLFRPLIPASEQWDVTTASLQVLQEGVRRCTPGEVVDLMEQVCRPETMKVELPLLRSDHESDCRRLARKVEVFRKEQLTDHGLPLQPVDVNKGEGVEFPKSAGAMDEKMTQSIEKEKFEMNKDSLVYLMDTLKMEWTEQDRGDLLASQNVYQGIGAAEPLTPPLSPMIEPLEDPYIPDEATCYVPDPSDPAAELSADLQAAERRIFSQDNDWWENVARRDVAPDGYGEIDVSEMLRSGALGSLSLPSSPRLIPRDFRVEVPVFPNSEPDYINTRVMELEDLEQAKVLISSDGTMGAFDDLPTHFQDSATSIMRLAEQETFESIDAIARQPVPVLDFSRRQPEWAVHLWQPKAMFSMIQKSTDVDWKGTKWSYSRAAEQKMVWAPLARMKEKELVSEAIEVDDATLNSLLGRTDDEEIPTSADYVAKTPGLAILRCGLDDDENDIVPLSQWTPAQTGREAIRRQDLAEMGAATLRPANPLSSGLDLYRAVRPRPEPVVFLGNGCSSREGIATPNSSPASSLGRPTLSINTVMLPTYSVLSKFQDPDHLLKSFLYFADPDKYGCFAPPPPEDPRIAKARAAKAAALLMPPPPPPTRAYAPEFKPPESPPRIIVSQAATGPITAGVKHLLPGIDLVRRNYNKYRPKNWFPGLRSPNLDEADITLSPATGILLSTMVKLRQKPIPGQTVTVSSLQQIVANVAARYERLIVFISEGNRHSETMVPLADSDAKALAEFQGFALGLETEIRVLYVGGGDETLAKWVAKTICDVYAQETTPVEDMLSSAESPWEVFLFRAGMNMFAAQVVLEKLKMLELEEFVKAGNTEKGACEEGFEIGRLARFVLMSQDERVATFSKFLGGRKVLDRVGQAIDEPWGQRAVGDEPIFDGGTEEM
ncbi:hypothetical protein QBC35DRAFT_142342 [Podospora australis]|uniref:Uncharacterized protein n=1 Tax=Podospora australis TaxID=1536484 RepID=A0AAN7AL58_9PEZI|nr:hypothetical protein QBC35DRAFT_142342 [Podospora australis]